VLSETIGRIDTVEIQYTRASATATWPCLRSFLSQLNTGAELIVVCGDSSDAASFSDASRELPLRKTNILVIGSPITGWSKDRFLVAQRGPNELICPASSPAPISTRSNDAKVAAALAKRWPQRFEAVQSDLVFDAGDILCTPTRVLVNDEIPAKNPLAKDWLQRVQRMTGRTPVWLKGSPGHHIGMFAAPIDDHTVVVGDPDLGAKLWTRDATRRLGKPDMSETAREPFRRAIMDLEDAGFTVVRTPLLFMEPKVYVTYTNAVFEQRGGEEIVFMPSYGVPELDSAAAKAYRSQGFDVKPVPVASVFRLCGTIGCLVNVLGRS